MKQVPPVFFAVFFLCTLFSCNAPSELYIEYAGFPEPERIFFDSVLKDSALQNLGLVLTDAIGPETIVVRFERHMSEWRKIEYENPLEFLPFSRVCMVLPAEVWDNKTARPEDFSAENNNNTLNGALIPLLSLAPPYVARKIGGFDVSSPYYPLVEESGIRFFYKGEHNEKAGEKIARLKQHIRKKLDEERNSAGDNAPAFCLEKRPVLFRIAAGGDIMLARGVEEILLKEGPEGVLGGTAPLARDADLSLANLEGAITDRGKRANKSFTFRFDPRCALAVKNAGFDAVLAANNHAFDFETEGFLDTLAYLEKAGLGILGAGRNISAAASPFVFTAVPFYNNGVIIPVRIFGIASYGKERTGWNGLDYAADVNKAGLLHSGKRGAELIKRQLDKDAMNIVMFHGGIEYADYPDNATRALYTDLVRSGADLIIGTHPHVEQGFEWVEGKPVFWSLGDYVFDQMANTPGGDKGIFVVLHYFGKILVHIDIYPVFMAGPRTVISPPEQLDRFYRLTKALAKK